MGKGEYAGEFEQLVLMALIRLRGKAYGVPVRREIEDRAGRSVSIGAVYTTLERLEKKGYVTSHLGEPTPERGGRAKKYFEITGAGENALQESVSAHARMMRGLGLAGAKA